MMLPSHFQSAARVLRCRAIVVWGAFLLAAAGSVPQAGAAQLGFVLDSTQSYLSLAIPNFTVEGTTVTITGQNRTNGAPITNAWSSLTGNRAAISGSFGANLGGSLTPGGVTSVEFVNGSANLVALNSGNYRPNPAAFNSVPPPGDSFYKNNSSAAAAYGGTVRLPALASNAGIFSMSNVNYALSSAAIPVAADQFSVNLPGNAVSTGLSGVTLGFQGLSFLLTALTPSELTTVTGMSANNTSATKGTVVVTPGLVTLTIPISVPISIPIGGGAQYLNGTGTGRIVAYYVPEPATIYLGGFGALVIGAMLRRARKNESRQR